MSSARTMRSIMTGVARRESDVYKRLGVSGVRRTLAGVVHGDGVVATHEDLGGVLVEGTLRVADVRDVPSVRLEKCAMSGKDGGVLDDDAVVGVLVGLVEDVVGANHVVNDLQMSA